MCGIIGYIGQNDCVSLLLDGLKRLEYRGYDSAGIAVIDEDDSFGSGGPQEEAWRTFRSSYPNRPFCLLIPNPEGGVSLPQNFMDDPLSSCTTTFAVIMETLSRPRVGSKSADYACTIQPM